MGRRSAALEHLGEGYGWALLDAAPDGILIVGRSGVVAYASDRAAGLFGCEVEDLLGISIEELVPRRQREVHRAHRTRYQAAPAVRMMGERLALRARRLDGSDFPVEVGLSHVEMGGEAYTVTSVRDISDRVADAAYLRQVVHAIDASPDGMFVFDADTFRFSFVSHGAVQLVAYSREELLEMTPLHLNQERTRAQYQRIIADLAADPGQAVTTQSRFVRKDGRSVPVEKTFQLVPPGPDETLWVVVLARDITRRLADERELQASQAALRSAERAAALADDRERIARDLHDTVIQRLFAEGLHLEAFAGRCDEATRTQLQSTVDSLDEAIRELRSAIFTLTRPEAVPAVRRELLEVVDRATSALGFAPRLRFEGPVEDVEASVAAHLAPVLQEALSNVARHAHASTVDVAVTADDRVTIEVTDDGVGVSNPQDPAEGSAPLHGNGLQNLAGRAALLDGSLELLAVEGGGSRLAWSVPASQS